MAKLIASSEFKQLVDRNVAKIHQAGLLSALWNHDLGVWAAYDEVAKKSISTRLGWLESPSTYREKVAELSSFANEVCEAGFTHAAVLGMGGSSLSVEVLRDVFGSKSGFPEMHVLDSTHPDQILHLEQQLDLKHTLFIVSSKSGSTLEPNCYFDYFWDRVQSVNGATTGSQFVSITDEASDLAKLSVERGFRRVFVNPVDIGGRFSVLSYFGLLPAAVMGIDVGAILDKALQEAANSHVLTEANASVRFGAMLAAAQSVGRDKLTILASPSLSSYGYWAEQLIAESTGKLGKGILPVEGEGVLPVENYGADRLFVTLLLDGETVDTSSLPGPSMIYHLASKYDLGSQFFRWEFATAVAGWLMGINPFDEPNVAESKANTNRVLAGQGGSTTTRHEVANLWRDRAASKIQLESFLEKNIATGKYIAIMAYVDRNAESINILDDFRKSLERKYSVATTIGFGPRFLHSTGQFHKGGPNEGIYIQITDTPTGDLAIPGKPFTFGRLIGAQAEGDRESLLGRGKPLIELQLGKSGAEVLREAIAA
jgi:glucose-6-phosphate isomerase